MTTRPSRFRGSHRLGVVLLASFLLVGLMPGAVLGVIPVAFTTQPAAATGGLPFGTQPIVTVTPSGQGGTMSLAINSGFSGAALSGCNTPSEGSGGDAGTYTFAGCKLDKTGTGTLIATWSGGGTDTSASFTVAVGAAAKLAFLQQPTSAVSAIAISPAVTVQIQDAGGNVVTSSAASVSVAISANPGGGTLSGTVSHTASSGVASFNDLSINKAGTGYTLAASSTGLLGATSTAFDITHAAASKLAFTADPARGIPSIAFAVQPVVVVQDAQGNTVTSDTTTIVTLTASSGFLTCSSTTSRTVSGGVATFSGCSLPSVGVGLTLAAASSPSYTGATSGLFDVSDRLLFTTQPSLTTAAGVAFAIQPVVAVKAGATNTATHDQGTVVTLSIKAGTGTTGATLTCDGGLNRTVGGGVASYTGCKIDKISPTSPANPYKILATATNLTGAESTNVTIAAGAATKLGFTAQPTGGVASQAFPIQPVVAVQDAGGNTVTSGTNSNATVALALGAGAPAGSVLTCTGGLTRVAVAGVATFAGCSVSAAGTFTLVASATGLTSATTNSFVVTAPVGTITLTNSASVITWGSAVGLTIQFGTNGGNKTFALQGARDGVSWTTIATLTTNSSGQATLSYRPATNLFYRVVFAGTLDLGAANSNTTRTVVREIALLRPTNFGATRSIARNTSITFTTTVRPSRPELPAAKVSFVFYRKVGSVWTRVTTRNVFINAAGKASTTFKFTRAGSWYVRSIANPTPFNANSVWSPLERYSVR